MTEFNEYQEYFNNAAPKYHEEVFTKNTGKEVKFLVEELNLPKGGKILDMGCGTGRHSIGLAEHGYKMTGVDWSEGMLNQAQSDAEKAGVEIEWICEDAKTYRLPNSFDATICLCEGAFGLLLKGEDPKAHDLAILRNIYDSLKPGSKLILGALNGFKKIRDAKQEDIISGKFDPITLVERFTLTYYLPNGGTKEVVLHEHGFLPGELKKHVEDVGFKVHHLWSGTAGDWKREIFNLDEIEIMVVATKPA
ncbi:MAG: class I SAM-dependent methyltransferase [candidate division Zixibacteria bacterium]|nr:class I SAM-dependent methyltransferase [candidate division Zixibacteria bacterium]